MSGLSGRSSTMSVEITQKSPEGLGRRGKGGGELAQGFMA